MLELVVGYGGETVICQWLSVAVSGCQGAWGWRVPLKERKAPQDNLQKKKREGKVVDS